MVKKRNRINKKGKKLQEDFFYGYTPAAASHVPLERPRINRLLEKAMQKPVVSVAAGAGYGKTQAVYAFAKKLNIRTVWIQISQEDNLGERFWENFVSAISIISRNTAEKLRQLDFPATERQFERFMSISRQVVIPNKKYLFVYDDIHLIADSSVLRFLEHCISSLFPNITSVLISRTEPSLRMEKLEAKKLLSRITGNDLRFSQDEMVSYFRLLNVSVEPRLVSTLYHDTEGWAFAIHMAGLSLRNVQGSTSHIRLLLKYSTSRLIESEIAASISPDLRRFLIKLSLVENLSPELVREIGKNPSLIEEMERIDTFIRFDSFMNTYRIHHFFLDYLGEKQDELSGEEKKDVWMKTALWCAANNRKMDAIACYDKAGDYGGIVNILNTLPLMLPTGMAQFIFDVLARAPETIYRDYPETIVIRIRVLNSLGFFDQNREETLRIIPLLKKMPDSNDKHGNLTACYLNLGFIGLLQSIKTKRYDFISFFKDAYDETRNFESNIKPPVNGIILSSYACRVMAPASAQDMENYIEMIGEIVPYSAQAMKGCQAGMHELCRGEYAFFKEELHEAEKQLCESLVKAREGQQYEIENRALFYLLRIHFSRGDSDTVGNIFAQLQAQLEEPFFLNRYFYHDIVAGWHYIQTGRKDKLAAWLKNDYEKSELNSRMQGLEKLVKAKFYCAEKRYPAALAIMKSRGDAEAIILGDIEMKALEAVCRYRLADKEGAFKDLQTAYFLAAPAGLFMPFIELGKDMRALTEAALKDMALGHKGAGISPQWLEEINRKAAVYAKKQYSQSDRAFRGTECQNNLILSNREMNVLTGLSQGLTREEIAGAASISPNTVKSAVKSIYNKLGALNKADAVRIAAERGILSNGKPYA
ncbi:MAG: LuxR C-terminal-related transcriptional regulator [Treponema sp.]|nr:LuxR C-terminal-related transcriptional regulator [Treponema sp.]